ncbi:MULTISPECIES: PLP-dependent aminotransferase family protein [Rhizobium]|uniref:MocR-like pyridoxine biosynthesis transcription factor PdxR n=1 Tax=Rhizobium TaxID=379 RepID=UPI001B31AD37|nr:MULTISPECIES: PLP-dependent aminotransferase family protein [Rhizobium]MBX4905947.1 PLP-dependent aminotransferase family protein [Rhizobium bangladeshense]MBX5212802.1 PLP-dependent aminotransferase family protein [Rhizobium sp. NLR9a]MBX5231488.1 PLP-dependent aminotransferase family protein [Rhizobium sp. NLR4a]MBX5243071.1 PLP-dependent aminotransferase family protein [Rhizobium sp. NLR3b]MBX5249126.1 PLP-dependent aminotransferase family protein [Rhizobium sp. NLR4b]
MSKRRSSIAIPSLNVLDRTANIGRQLAQALRSAIARGELRPGERLPSTRTLAASLKIARGTVVEVFDQLTAEGYLEARVGAGTRVAAALTDASPAIPPAPAEPAADDAIDLPAPAARLISIARALTSHPPVPFAISVPAAGIAPDDNWRRLGNRVRASKQAAPSGYQDPMGLLELRLAIAEHVRRARAVHCEPEQVIVTSGTQQGLYMAGRVLLSRHDPVWAEDPAYPGLTAVLDDLGLRTHRLPVDAQGMNVERGLELCPEARAAFVTASHQYPIGMPLSMTRRNALIAWADRNRAWIVEDDYDSELRYAGHPFPSMQGLRPSRVIYLGTFSKVLFPSLRLGYAIVPPPLAEAFAGARAILDRHSPIAEQHVLAAYMREGYFEAHIRRIRSLYAERRAILLAALERALPQGCQVQPSDQGMHVLLWLPEEMDDVRLAARALSAGLAVRAISPMYAAQPARAGLMLGFGGFPQAQLEAAVGELSRLLQALIA